MGVFEVNVFARVGRRATLGLGVDDRERRRDFGGRDMYTVLVQLVWMGSH